MLEKIVGVDDADVLCLYEYTPLVKGKFDGPWEDCYDSEPEELEIYEAYIDGNDVMHFSQLMSDVKENLLDAIHEDIEDGESG